MWFLLIPFYLIKICYIKKVSQMLLVLFPINQSINIVSITELNRKKEVSEESLILSLIF